MNTIIPLTHCKLHCSYNHIACTLLYPSRFTFCPCQLEELQARGIHFQAAGATAALLDPTHCQVAGLLLDCTVFGGPQHNVRGCGPLWPARTTFGFSEWVVRRRGDTCILRCKHAQIISTKCTTALMADYWEGVGEQKLRLNPWRSASKQAISSRTHCSWTCIQYIYT